MGVKPFGNVQMTTWVLFPPFTGSRLPRHLVLFSTFCFALFYVFGFGHSVLFHISPKYHTPHGKPRKASWSSGAPKHSRFFGLSVSVSSFGGGVGWAGRCAHRVFLPTIFMAENSGWIVSEKHVVQITRALVRGWHSCFLVSLVFPHYLGNDCVLSKLLKIQKSRLQHGKQI